VKKSPNVFNVKRNWALKKMSFSEYIVWSINEGGAGDQLEISRKPAGNQTGVCQKPVAAFFCEKDRIPLNYFFYTKLAGRRKPTTAQRVCGRSMAVALLKDHRVTALLTDHEKVHETFNNLTKTSIQY
jgi:hypothetical protein